MFAHQTDLLTESLWAPTDSLSLSLFNAEPPVVAGHIPQQAQSNQACWMSERRSVSDIRRAHLDNAIRRISMKATLSVKTSDMVGRAEGVLKVIIRPL